MPLLIGNGDRYLWLAGGAALLVAAFGCGFVTAAHRAREARERECVSRIEQAAARRGLVVVRLAALVPCETGAR